MIASRKRKIEFDKVTKLIETSNIEDQKVASTCKDFDSPKSKPEGVANQVQINKQKFDAESNVVKEGLPSVDSGEGSDKIQKAIPERKEELEKDAEIKSNIMKEEILVEKLAEEKRVEKIDTATTKSGDQINEQTE